MARKSKAPKSQFSPRERFNWGFWDGLHDRQRGKIASWYRGASATRGHFDGVYSEGYVAGLWHTGEAPQTSDAAWASCH